MKKYYKVKVYLDGNKTNYLLYLVACCEFVQWLALMNDLYINARGHESMSYHVLCKETHDLFGARYVRI